MALVKLQDLARLAGPDIPSVNVGNGNGKPVALSSRLIEHVEAVLGPDVQTIGTIEGNLEGLIIHGKRRFLVYDPLTGHQTTCYFTPRVDWQHVLQAFGKRVAVTGVIQSRSSGETMSITASRLYVFPLEGELPLPEQVLGAARIAQ